MHVHMRRYVQRVSDQAGVHSAQQAVPMLLGQPRGDYIDLERCDAGRFIALRAEMWISSSSSGNPRARKYSSA